MNGIDIIYHDQDCNMKFISEHQELCRECYNNSKKDENYPYISIATDPTWIIMESITQYDTQLYIKCSHEQEYEHLYKQKYDEKYDEEYQEEYEKEYQEEYEKEYDYKYDYEYKNIDTLKN